MTGTPKSWRTTLPVHPAAELFPMMTPAELRELGEDIKAHGLQSPIAVARQIEKRGNKYQLLDGRNRFAAMELVGVPFTLLTTKTYCCFEGSPYPGPEGCEEPVVIEVDGDPYAYVISANLHRRHLNESQRAMVAAKLANMRQGTRTDLAPIGAMSDADAATMLGVGERSVERAKTVHREGAPELVAAVEQGKVSVSAATDVASRPVEEQQEIVARGEKEILEAAKAIRAEKVEQKRAVRVARADRIRANNTPLPVSERKYCAIYADPPWSYEVWAETGKYLTHADNYFPTMSLQEIKALPVAGFAAEDCALFLWVTWPLLFAAKEVIEAWGFEYKTCAFTWVKPTQDGDGYAMGNGYWTRANSEVCLLATKGFPVRLNADVSQVVLAPRRAHSQKPDEMYERIERLVPGPYIELFARGVREGWDRWGNEAPPALDCGSSINLREVQP
jgi:N6-adenosine-specific RNA methylase IME4/ParB-like chromosome segregation protein Spo0J